MYFILFNTSERFLTTRPDFLYAYYETRLQYPERKMGVVLTLVYLPLFIFLTDTPDFISIDTRGTSNKPFCNFRGRSLTPPLHSSQAYDSDVGHVKLVLFYYLNIKLTLTPNFFVSLNLQ